MNTTFKGLLLIVTFLGLTFSLFNYSRDILGTQIDNYIQGGNLQYYIYTDNLGRNTYKVSLVVNGLKEGQELIIHRIIINDRDISVFDQKSLINGKNGDIAFPLKLNYTDNTIEIILHGVISGQFLNIRLDTSIGTFYMTVSL